MTERRALITVKALRRARDTMGRARFAPWRARLARLLGLSPYASDEAIARVANERQ